MTKIAMTKIAMTKARRTGLMLALVAAVISGFAIFLNGYGVKAVGNATVYTTAKNVVAAGGTLVCALAWRRAPRELPAAA